MQGGRDPRPDDHRRPRHHRRSDRAAARDRGPGVERNRVRGAERRGARGADRGHRRRGTRRAGGQGAARRHAQAQGQRRRDDRRRCQRRSRPQAGRHRRRDGDHGHRGDEGSGRHDPHRRQLRHDRERGRGRPGDLRQPDEVHPCPADHAGRVHPHVRRRGDLRRRERHAADAAADPVDQLRRRRASGDRARLRRACAGIDAPRTAGCERTDRGSRARHPARSRQPGDGRSHHRRGRVGRAPLRPGHRDDDGPDDALADARRRSARDARADRDDLQALHVRQPEVRAAGRVRRWRSRSS